MIEFLAAGNAVKVNDNHDSELLALFQNLVEDIHVAFEQICVLLSFARVGMELPTQKIDIPFPHRREICASIYNRGHHSTQLRQG